MVWAKIRARARVRVRARVSMTRAGGKIRTRAAVHVILPPAFTVTVGPVVGAAALAALMLVAALKLSLVSFDPLSLALCLA